MSDATRASGRIGRESELTRDRAQFIQNLVMDSVTEGARTVDQILARTVRKVEALQKRPAYISPLLYLNAVDVALATLKREGRAKKTRAGWQEA